MSKKTIKPSLDPMPACDAIKACGGTGRVTRALGVTRQTLHQWEVVPVARLPEIEHLSGIDRKVIRPDVFRETWLTCDGGAAA